MRVIHFDTTDSTMREAAQLAAQGCASGTAVVADEQTVGRGRHGHSWYSEKGAGLYCSVVLRLGLPQESLTVLTLALGLATAEAIARATDIPCDLRWPNDVLIGRKKVAGILVQLEGDAAIAGIGINVNHAAFPEEIAAEATSLRIASGRSYARQDLLDCLLPAVESFGQMLRRAGPRAIIDLFCRNSSYACGRRVVVDGAVRGTTAGLDSAGFLIVEREDGARTVVLAGGVRAAGA